MAGIKLEPLESKECDWKGLSEVDSSRSNNQVEVKKNPEEDEKDSKANIALDSKICSQEEEKEVKPPAAPARLISRIKGAHHPWGWHHRTVMESEAKVQLVPTMLANPELGDRKVVVDKFLANAPAAVLRMIAKGDEKTINESEVAIKESEMLVSLKEFVDEELAILVKKEEVTDEREGQRLPDQKAAEEMAAGILGTFINAPTVALLLPRVLRISASEWQAIRGILEEDQRAHTDFDHLSELFEIKTRPKGQEGSCS